MYWLSVEAGNGKIVATLTGYAYETVPNTAIHAGQTQGATVNARTSDLFGVNILTTPEATSNTLQPESLGELALGTRRIPFWRWP
jgi:hypothetical protein